jgi:hypothetical protein
MVKLLLVREGEEDEIAECTFTDDGETLFESYKKQDRYHVKLVYYGLFSEPQITKEFIPTE